MVFLTKVHRVEHEGKVLAAEGGKSHLNDGDDDEDDDDDNEDVDDYDLLDHAVQHGVESEVRSQVSGQQGHCVRQGAS